MSGGDGAGDHRFGSGTPSPADSIMSGGEGAGDLQFGPGPPSPQADELLIDVLMGGLSYHAEGLLQSAFPTPSDREALIGELSEHSFWRFANGGDSAGLGAGSWSCCLIAQDAVDAMRELATPANPGIGQLLRLHDALQAAAEGMHAGATRPAEAPGQKRKGSRDRRGSALQNFTLRVHVPTPHRLTAMSSSHHRDIYGEAQ